MHNNKLTIKYHDLYKVDQGQQGEDIDCATINVYVHFQEQSNNVTDLSSCQTNSLQDHQYK